MEFLFILAIAAVIGYAIYTDAKARGMNAVLWGIASFAFALLAVPLYLIVRKPRLPE